MELLQNTSLNFVMDLVDIVSGGILEIIDKEYNNFLDLDYHIRKSKLKPV